MTLQKAIAGRICNLCLERRISYYELSYMSAVPLTTILHVVDGSTRNPGLQTISKICEGLNMRLAEFFDSEEFNNICQEEE